MTRQQGIQFIRENSRAVRITHLNPIDKRLIDDDYDANYSEQRLTNNGIPFVLNDYGRHGWDLYLLVGGNETDSKISKFCELSGINTSYRATK